MRESGPRVWICGCLFFSRRLRRSWGLSTVLGNKASDLIGKSPERRKLIAVIYADMAGYSRLIGLDDAGTLDRIQSPPQGPH